MKKNKKIIILLILVCLLSGCTKTLKDKDKKAVVNEKTGSFTMWYHKQRIGIH